MTPSILIRSEGAVAAPLSAPFFVGPGEVQTLFVRGLAGEEEVDLEILADEVEDPATAADALWVNLAKLTVADPAISLDTPGIFRLRIAESAGAVVIGAY
jgi:hypothetical protein